MFLGARSMLQARVDDNCEVIARLIESVPVLIHNQFSTYEDEAKTVAIETSDGDRDMYCSVYNSICNQYIIDDEEWMISEFYRSIVMLIVSFAETTIKGLLKNPQTKISSNILCKAFRTLNTEYSLGLKSIGKYWKGYQLFIHKRNDIAHNNREVCVSAKELMKALKGVHILLRAVANAFDQNNIIPNNY